jgi:Fur family ferric uptake transcriptional regulator
MEKNQTQLAQTLREAGFRATEPRLAILHFLARARKPVSVPMLVQRLRSQQIDTVTAYRTLEAFKTSGLVRQIDFEHDHAYYELTAQGEHHHAVCIRCARVEDIRDCCAKAMEEAALEQSGFAAIHRHSLEFFGLCKACATKHT